MSAIGSIIRAVEAAPLHDPLTRLGIDLLVARTRRRLAGPNIDETFARSMAGHPVAEHPEAANRQHYELPSDFFDLVLGPRRKYSCCLYPDGTRSLASAELAALTETVAHADLADGQDILELGCGWGSLTLFMAERFPACHITGVSNSRSQREFILAEAHRRGLANVEIVTCDMNDFAADRRFDRIVSVEMFEHMANWDELFGRVKTWLLPDGRLFIHVFTTRQQPYRFDPDNDADWIAQHFFTGGIMPSHGLMHHFPQHFSVEQEWWWNGSQYQRTALDWLKNFDSNRVALDRILVSVYGADAALWRRRWRLFFLATAGLFGHDGGNSWGVSHYRLRAASDLVSDAR